MRTLLLAAALSPLALQAQNFFNGQPGPGNAQLETRVNENGGVTIPKYFDKENNYLIVTPITFDEAGIRNVGVNAGYMAQEITKNTHAIAMLGLFRNGEGKYQTVNPQLYLTQHLPVTEKYFSTIDAEVSAPTDTATGTTRKSAAILPGFGIAHYRGGVGVSWQANSKPSYTIVGRVDSKNHKVWGQVFYKPKEKEMSFGIVLNLGVN